ADAVRDATTDSPEYIDTRELGSESYEPGKLVRASTYYWRVDEVNDINADSPWIGSVWSFTTADFAIVDNFEDYESSDAALENQIWFSWLDGAGYFHPDAPPYLGNGTGSEIGDPDTASFTEESIVHGPYKYNNNDPTKLKYSEAKMTLSALHDWTEQGVKALSLWFRGYPASVGSFTDNFDGTYTMTASGTDIWNVPDFTGAPDGYYHDEFHFAYKPMNGPGSIIARVDSVSDTHDWAKAGVMIRETLNANSAHAFACVTPSSGVSFQRRPSTGATSTSTNSTTGDEAAPYWVKLERDISGFFTASFSDDGQNWTDAGVPEPISMGLNAFIGLAVTAHNASATCQGEFSNIQVSVSSPWANQDIGIQSNEPERMYVAISNSNGTIGTVYYEDNDNIDPNATLFSTWTEFNIDLKDFQDQGVNLADVNSIAIGIGNRDNPQAGGSGKMYFDDIALYRPRCMPDMVTLSQADLNSDCMVDFRDLEIMVGDWFANDPDLKADLNVDSMVDFKDYAVLADEWLDEQLWPEW
ncbi:MAG: DUF1349 domain-containing protein, partial [Planctomycetota bacterium]